MEDQMICETFLVYSQRAVEGEKGYSARDHSAPHKEGLKNTSGREEWVLHYSFNKRADGSYDAELDQAWYWGGSHLDGGQVNRTIPKQWFDLTYDEFLENVITLCGAARYKFTVEDLKEQDGLKEFFGYEY